MNLDDKLTPLLYMSKVNTFQTCPMKYYWQHHLHLGTKQRPDYFAFGSGFHRACIEVGMVHGWHVAEAILNLQLDLVRHNFKANVEQKIIDELTAFSEKDRNLLLDMMEAFKTKWESLGVQSILAREKSVKYDLSQLSSFFTSWVVKADFIFQDAEGLWVGDIKTTSGYGPAVARYYHDSPQTKTYFWILSQLMPNLRGTKIFVVTKRAVRCEVETIILSDQDKYQAELFVKEAVRAINDAEEQFDEYPVTYSFPRYMTQCVNHYGQECPYSPICINQIKDEAYLNELLTNWYSIQNPDEHLELED